VEEAEPWEVGAGFIDLGQVERFLADLTPSRWLSVFCPAAVTEQTQSSLRELDTTLGPLWDPLRIGVFKDLLWSGIQLFNTRVVEPEAHMPAGKETSDGR
jgi:hypothetical protein